MVSCICKKCGVHFEKSKSEYNRKIKLGTSFFCSLKCSGSFNTSHLDYWRKSEENKNFIKQFSGSKKDNYSPFRETLKKVRSKSKSKNRDYDIDLKYLREVWEKQEGKCPYLKKKLILPLTNQSHDKSNPNLVASLDRIDSSKGYIKGNIQFISTTLNFAKNKYTEDVLLNLIEMCATINIDVQEDKNSDASDSGAVPEYSTIRGITSFDGV